jgi:hypothetical protein
MSTRREFLRSALALTGVGGPPLMAACQVGETGEPGRGGATAGAGERATRDPEEGGAARSPRPAARELPVLSRPILRPWADDMVWLAAPATTLPAAYVSVARREVYVDSAYRDRASWLLRAHISVSTGLWRIPLAGDPPRRPIPPGDEAREFEERPMRAWDPTGAPGMDDIRIVRGGGTSRQIDFSCVPLVGAASAGVGSTWLSGGPFAIEVANNAADDTVREDFGIIGVGLRFRDRTCPGGGEAVQYVGWRVVSWPERADSTSAQAR